MSILRIIISYVALIYLVSSPIITTYGLVFANYNWEKIESNWTLADRSSTIEQKSKYMNLFLGELDELYSVGKIAQYNALIFKTPKNNSKNNIDAVRSLSSRLDEIKTLSPSSFEYNQAIQQITAQEQGEAEAMIRTIRGAYVLGSYWYVWSWYLLASVILWNVMDIGLIKWMRSNKVRFFI